MSNQVNLVSIVTPSYNNSSLIDETIISVLEQTYTEWEMLIVDDCSSDNTCEIVEGWVKKDGRIHLIRLNKNLGAANARNTALIYAKGKYIAYLDADDIWYPDKLKKQIEFMSNNSYYFSCTSYEVVDNNGLPLNKYVHMLPWVNYKSFLINNLLQTVGIMVDISKIDKTFLEMPNIRRRQDAATWLQVLKNGYKCYGLDEILAKYRRTKNSLSSNKIKAVKGTWYLYRKIEHLSLVFSFYCFFRYVILAIWKRIYFKRG